MTDNEVRQLILDIIHDIAPDEDLSDVKPDVRLREQLDLDSMDFLDIVMELRKRHKIEVPEEDYMQLATLDGCVAYLQPKFAAIGSSAA
ncbi:MAG: acyl carrier protein [Deltaproteobacteria bacterium]|nr:acyl carrier protein [Deltaproteobacteria bacterium]